MATVVPTLLPVASFVPTRVFIVLPPKLTLSEWADMYRMLSPENSAEPGRWRTDKAPYQKEIMDAIGSPHVRKIVIMSAAQIGKTAMLMNMLGSFHNFLMKRN